MKLRGPSGHLKLVSSDHASAHHFLSLNPLGQFRVFRKSGNLSLLLLLLLSQTPPTQKKNLVNGLMQIPATSGAFRHLETPQKDGSASHLSFKRSTSLKILQI